MKDKCLIRYSEETTYNLKERIKDMVVLRKMYTSNVSPSVYLSKKRNVVFFPLYAVTGTQAFALYFNDISEFDDIININYPEKSS